MATTIAIILSLPILALMVVFDIIKFPILLFVLWPLWGFIDLIQVLRGEHSQFVCMVKMTTFMGIHIWLMIVGLESGSGGLCHW